MSVRIMIGDVRAKLAELPDESVHCVVTSPPYLGLRDYGIPASVWGGDEDCDHDWGDVIVDRATNHTDKRRWQHTRNGRDEEQPTEKRVGWLRSEVPQGKFCQRCNAWAGVHGLEPTPGLYTEHEVLIFRAVRRVLRDDGTLWLNLGDSYNAYNGGAGPSSSISRGAQTAERPQLESGYGPKFKGLKPKDLIGIPWRVAFALQADGWYLRQDIIWSKPNPMPESVTDRCTKAHEYLFLLSKSARYYYDQDAILEPASPNTHARLSQDVQAQIGSDRVPGKTNGTMEAVSRSRESWNGSTFDGPRDLAVRPDTGRKRAAAGSGIKNNDSMDAALAIMPVVRNRRSVWTVATQPFSEAHFATFPPALVEPCVLAGCPAGGTVLDPFGGAGTTGLVADRLGRNAILIELNPEYAAIAERRIKGDAGMFAEMAVA